MVAVAASAGRLWADSPPAAPAPQNRPKAAALAKQFDEWKQLLAELAKMNQKYISAPVAEKKELQKQYDELVAKGEAMHDRLNKAVEEAYVEASGADPQVELQMGIRCHHAFEADDYEEVFRLARLMIEHGAQEKRLYLWGGISAFCIGELDKAKEYLTTAVKKGVKLASGKDDPLDVLVREFHHDPRRHEKAWKEEQEIRAREAEADDLPRVLLKTNRGDIELELFENEAPNTTANFISLIEQGFYDDLSFHRVLPGFMMQGGCPKGDGTGDPGYSIACECNQPNHRKHFRGSLSMAHAGPDTGGSQFFITLVPTTHLNGHHTVFGRVIKGMDVLAKIQKRDPSDPKETYAPPDRILETKVLRKRPHPYEVKKIEK